MWSCREEARREATESAHICVVGGVGVTEEDAGRG